MTSMTAKLKYSDVILCTVQPRRKTQSSRLFKDYHNTELTRNMRIHGQSVKQRVQNGPRTVDFVLDGIAHFVFSLLAVQYI
jgi:hypothetical protein